MPVRCTPLAALAAVAALLVAAPAAGAKTVVVDDNRAECPNAGFDTIQAAVSDAAPGDVVAVCAGTYRESSGGLDRNGVTIAKPLTLKGAGAHLVRIEPAADLREVAPADGRYDATDGEGNVISVTGGPVDISGVTVAGGSPSDPRGAEAGIGFTDSSGSVTRSRVTDLVPADIDDFSNNVGYGIVAYAAGASTRSVGVANTLVERHAKGGVLIRGAATTGTVRDSVIRGRGPLDEPGKGQNGIQVSFGASATIEGNSVVDHRYLPDESSSVGVLLYDADVAATKITGNDFTGNGYGIFNADIDGCDSATPVAASDNYWGHPSGPTVDPTSAPPACPTTPYGPTGDPAFGDRVNGAAVTYEPHAPIGHGTPVAPGTEPDAAPDVAVDAPADGSIVPPGSDVTLTASATDDFDVSRVDFLRDGVVVASDSDPAYSAQIPGPPSGETVAITAIAYDSTGQSASDTISVKGDAAPTVSITSPGDGARLEPGQTFRIEAEAADDVAVDNVRFIVGGQTVPADPPADPTGVYSADLTAPGPGQTQDIVAEARDARGQVASDSISVTGRDDAPTVSITSPQDGATVDAGQPFQVDANASSDTERVEFRIGSQVETDNEAPFSHSLTGPAEGQTQAVKVVAFDARAQTATDSVSVRGRDNAPTVSITSPQDGATVDPGKPFRVDADASTDTKRVEFRRGVQVVADAEAPFSGSLTGPSAGQSQAVVVVAFDAGGQTGSDAISVSGRRPPLAPREPAPPEDRPPSVSFASPGPGAGIDPAAAPRLTANAADDNGIVRVVFLDDGKVVCVDEAAPYDCPYAPSGDDVGRNTLIALAHDGAGQTAVDFRPVNVGRFNPVLTAKTTPKRDRRRPYRYRTTGKLTLPAGVTAAQACGKGGGVQVQFAAGRLKLPTIAMLRADCSFRTAIAFPTRRPLGRRGRLTVTYSFAGNEVLGAAKGKKRRIRAG